MADQIISGIELGEVVCEALGLDAARVSRIVIELDCSRLEPARVYVEMIADERLLHVSWGDAKFEIVGRGDDTP